MLGNSKGHADTPPRQEHDHEDHASAGHDHGHSLCLGFNLILEFRLWAGGPSTTPHAFSMFFAEFIVPRGGTVNAGLHSASRSWWGALSSGRVGAAAAIGRGGRTLFTLIVLGTSTRTKQP